MKKINTITDAPNQNIVMVLDDGSKINMILNYFSNQQGWFFSLNYNNNQFKTGLRRLVMSPNLLSAFQNIIPFGMAVTTTDGYEPVFIDDFISGRASFYVLNQTDVSSIQELISNA